jgi:hypothetical protein
MLIPSTSNAFFNILKGEQLISKKIRIEKIIGLINVHVLYKDNIDSSLVFKVFKVF